MRMGQGVRTGLGHGGITCVLQTQFSIFFFSFFLSVRLDYWLPSALHTAGTITRKYLNAV